MSGLLFLSSNDFRVSKGTNGDILCNSIPGFSLILFYSTQCKHCKNLIPIFKKLPGTIGGCQFGMINVSTNKQCVKMAMNTIAPIKYVPYMVLYIQGKPFMKYNGPHRDEDIRKFIVDVSNKIKNKQSFTKGSVKNPKKRGIPEYCTGVPIKGSKDQMVCYLTFEEYGN